MDDKYVKDMGENILTHITTEMTLKAYYVTNVDKVKYPTYELWYHTIAEIVT